MAVTPSGTAVSCDRTTPGVHVTTARLQGLMSGESIIGIDTRPADSLINTVSSSGRILTLDPASGALSPKATLTASPGDDAPFTALSAGARFGVDFNPAADRLRVVSDGGFNLRVNVDSGDAITDGAINGGLAGRVITGSWGSTFPAPRL